MRKFIIFYFRIYNGIGEMMKSFRGSEANEKNKIVIDRNTLFKYNKY